MDLHGIPAAHGLGAQAHAFLRKRAAHGLRVRRDCDVQRTRELGLAQRRAYSAQVEPGRFKRPVEALRIVAAAALEHAAAGERDAQLVERCGCQVATRGACLDAGNRQARLVQRPWRAVRERERSLQAALGARRLYGEREGRVRQLLAEAREVDRRHLGTERYQVLRAEGCEHDVCIRGNVALAKREPRL